MQIPIVRLRTCCLALAVCPIQSLPADNGTSASYSITTDIADAVGTRATSASYTNDGSAGGVAGLSTVAAPAETANSGYVAQLYDVTGLTLTANDAI